MSPPPQERSQAVAAALVCPSQQTLIVRSQSRSDRRHLVFVNKPNPNTKGAPHCHVRQAPQRHVQHLPFALTNALRVASPAGKATHSGPHLPASNHTSQVQLLLLEQAIPQLRLLPVHSLDELCAPLCFNHKSPLTPSTKQVDVGEPVQRPTNHETLVLLPLGRVRAPPREASDHGTLGPANKHSMSIPLSTHGSALRKAIVQLPHAIFFDSHSPRPPGPEWREHSKRNSHSQGNNNKNKQQ
jgi:hypothetical protein